MASVSDQEPDAVREGRELLDAFYFPDDEYGRAEEFRENAIRLIVFDMHLAIEDLLKFFLHARVTEQSVLDADADINYIKELNSRQAIDLAARLGVINLELHGNLVELNSLRNRAGHTWSLGEPEMGPDGPKPGKFPLRWKGKRLTPEIVKDEFLPLYGRIYEGLFGAYLETLPDPVESKEEES
ncbi:MAG: hypothetical protein ACRDJ3_02535 [Solirubrobacteraceae bacterium]